MIYNKPDYSTGVWADEGNIAYPTSEKIEQGHIVEKPFYEIMNYLQNRSDTANAYLLQNGLPEWDRLTTYPIDAYIKHSGVVYKALSQNEDSEPSPTSQIWTQAFPTYEDFLNYIEEIRKIKEDEGYLGLYVSKAQPVMTGKAQGVAYLANTGLISTGNESVGYSFNQHQRDGIFHDGNSAVAMNDGVIVGKFTNTQDAKRVVTVDLLEEYINNAIRYKVGDLYFTTVQTNPQETLGYGTWQAYAQGSAIVGVSSNENDPVWTRIGGSKNHNKYSLKIEEKNLPPHSHGQNQQRYGQNLPMSGASGLTAQGAATVYESAGGNNGKFQILTTSVGSGEAIDITQPSISVYIWRRVS